VSVSSTQTQGKLKIDRAAALESAKWLTLLRPPGMLTGLRVPKLKDARRGQRVTVAGVYTDLIKLANDAHELSVRAPGVYFNLNTVATSAMMAKPELLNYCRFAPSGTTVKDNQIERRDLLLVDVDAIRPADASSTEDELAAAVARAEEIEAALSARGWPKPLRVMSGNGCHLYYRVELPADDGGLVHLCLEAAAAEWGTPAVKVDTTVGNASRISRVPGTWARKGDDTAERPHRRSEVLSAPDVLAPVAGDLLRNLADKAPRPSATTTVSVPALPRATAPVDWPRLLKIASARLASCAPSVQKQNGSGALVHALCGLNRLGLSAEDSRGLILSQFNPRCSTPWSDQEIEHAVSRVYDPSGKYAPEHGVERAAVLAEGGSGWEMTETIGGRSVGSTPAPAPAAAAAAVPEPEPRGAGAAGTPRDGGRRGPDQGQELLSLPLTDVGNARRLALMYGDRLRYCATWKKWLHWDGLRWRLDVTGAVVRAEEDVAAELYRLAVEAMMQPDARGSAERRAELLAAQRWAIRSESASRINAAVELARAEPRFVIEADALDTHLDLLNCLNGTVDLTTGQLRPHDPANYITQLAPVVYDPQARCAEWLKFLRSVFNGSEEMVSFVRRWLGYCLTGHIREQALPVLWGAGANGKSTLATVFLELLGTDYAMQAAAELLMMSRGERHPTELADLFGRRLVIASETAEGGRLNEARLKSLTGGETVRARRMREDNWEFSPRCKIMLLTNHKPAVRESGEGVWRRLRLVPFTRRFWSADEPGAPKEIPPELLKVKDLPDRLRAEHAGILAWAVRGAVEWHQEGLPLPRVIRAATQEYREAEDLVAQWLDDCCVRIEEYRSQATQIYTHFRQWCEGNGRSGFLHNANSATNSQPRELIRSAQTANGG
jgi:P4 family phage/plasmid primase-like protien